MLPSFNVTTDTRAPLGAAMPDSGTPIEVPPLYARLPKPFAAVKSFCEPGKHKLKHSILRTIVIGLSLLTFTSAQAAEGTVTFEVLTPEVALQAAQAALENCRASGYHSLL